VFTVLSVVSLLLCLATLILWVQSGWRVTIITGRLDDRKWVALQSVRAQLDLFFGNDAASWISPRVSFHSGGAHHATTAAEFAQFARNPTICRSGIGAPHWFLALLFAILPAIQLRAILRSRRQNRQGLCPRCGYDLRATLERCPECGTESAFASNAQNERG
jgi:hypothetical protein